jgi:hypothetical protein
MKFPINTECRFKCYYTCREKCDAGNYGPWVTKKVPLLTQEDQFWERSEHSAIRNISFCNSDTGSLDVSLWIHNHYFFLINTNTHAHTSALLQFLLICTPQDCSTKPLEVHCVSLGARYDFWLTPARSISTGSIQKWEVHRPVSSEECVPLWSVVKVTIPRARLVI